MGGLLLSALLAGVALLVVSCGSPDEPVAPATQPTTSSAERAQSLRRLHEAWRSVGVHRLHEDVGAHNAFRLLPDGRVLTAGRDHDAVLWDAAGVEIARFSGHRGPVLDVRLSPAGDRVLTASSDGTARLFDVAGDTLAVLRGHAGAVRSARFGPAGKRLLTVGLDGDARLWSSSGALLGVLADAGAATLEAHVLAGGTLILTRDDRGEAHLFDGEAHALKAPAGFRDVAGLRLGPDVATALLLASDGRVLRFDARTRRTVPLVGHGARVLDAVVQPTSGLVATASLDGTARLWSPEGESLHVLRGHGLAVVRVALDAAGTRVLTLGADGHARLWSERGVEVMALEGPAFADVGFDGRGEVVWAVPREGRGLWLYDDAGGLIRTLLPDAAAPLGVEVATGGASLGVLTAERRLLVVEPGGEASVGAGSAKAAAAEVGEADVGTAVCAGCHRKEYDLWATSNHARTMEPAVAGNLPPVAKGGGLAVHPPGSTRFVPQAGGFLARTTGPDGAPHDYPVGWVAGRRRIRMYVTTMPDGRMQVLPSMRAELTGTWFDYTQLLFGGPPGGAPIVKPGDDAFWTGAGRSFGARCARCHASGAAPRLPSAAQQGPRSTWRDLGVDCEACHGPGRAHARAWARLDTGAPLMKLGTLDRKAAIEACTRCHMEGEVVQSGFALGEDLYEALDPTLLLDPERVDARGRPLELIYHGLSFGVSRCAQQGGLTCERCHDAHGGPHPALLGRPPTNDALCSECHVEIVREAAKHSHHDATGSGGSCVGCHMPRLVIERGHGIITDHSIGVPDPTARGEGVARDACSWCHEGGLGAPKDVPRLTQKRIRAGYARWWPTAKPARPWMTAIQAGRTHAPGAGALLVAILDDDVQPRLVRASAARLLGGEAATHAEALYRAAHDADSLVRRSAVRALGNLHDERADAALLAALGDPSAAVRFAAARTALEGWQRVQENGPLLDAVRPVLAEEARAVPNDEMRWFRLGAACDVAGDVAGAIEAYGHMVALHPLAHYVRKRLGELRALKKR